MKIEAAGKTEIGTVRMNNEDTYFIDESKGIFIVCDGVGGEKAGEVASQTAVTETVKYLLEEYSYLEDCRKGRFTDDAVFRFVADSIRHSCKVIYDLSNENPLYHNMGTTITMAVTMGSRILICHVGDSRAYLVNEQGSHLLSDDHTLVKDFVKKGLFKNESEAPEYLKNILTRSLGKYPSVEVDCVLVTVTEGEHLVLCTDGVSSSLRKKDLFNIIDSEPNLNASIDKLIGNALKNDGSDNATAIILKIFEESGVSDFEYLQENRISELLQECPAYEDLSFSEISRMRSHMKVVYLRKNEVLVNSCEMLAGLYIVIDGCISNGEEILRDGDYLGIETMIHNVYTPDDVVAVKDTRLLFFSKRRFDLYSQRYPWTANRILRNVISIMNDGLDQ